MWSYHEDCSNFVKTVWSLQTFGSPMQILSQKLKRLKEELKVWNKNIFGDIHKQVKKSVDKLDQIQYSINIAGGTDDLLNQEKLAKIELERALNIEEKIWKEKARINWHCDGDRNTAYFHRTAKIKQAYKKITSLRIENTVITQQDQIASHVVAHFSNIFTTNNQVQDNGLVEEVIPALVTEQVNNLLTMLPSTSEIKNAVFAMNKDGAPGPDGFGAFFYQTYGEVIKNDVTNAVLEFFTSNWISPNWNANTVVLVPKVPNADTISQFRPIAMANFKFKIISKILADRLALILPYIVSKEQRGFIKGRQIKDCICLTSEAINMLYKKSFGGNLAIKIDIAKAFDTIDWNFLLKVLKSFGFNSLFCNWINTILHSAKLSISVNGKSEGYFSCSRGVRQGDPLSPLLFCLAEEVLSRGISKLVENGHLQLIKGTRHNALPSHILYADDVMLFCKGTSQNIQILSDFFTRYAQISGQIINAQKSTLYVGSMTHARLMNIANTLGFMVGTLPFIYLGVPIFKGKPKAAYFQPVVDKIKLKLASWKASLLSFAGRLQLIKSVVESMMIYSITIYNWPVKLIKELEKYMRNFLWSGDLNSRKLVIVAWKKVCTPIEEGGLGIRSISMLNDATNLKLGWELMHSHNQWAQFLRRRVKRGNGFINYHIFSSLWTRIKSQIMHIRDNTTWLLGDGKNINFWWDNWSGVPLTVLLNIPDHYQQHLHSTVNDFIHNSQWNVPQALQVIFPNLVQHISNITIPIIQKEDQLIWNKTTSSDLELKDAYTFFSPPTHNRNWAKLIWNQAIPPSKSFMVWRLFHKKMPTDENLKLRGCSFPSMCTLCSKEAESAEHLFLNCTFAKTLWSWLQSLINLNINVSSVPSLFDICNRGWSPQCKLVIISAIVNILNTIWSCRNNLRFNGSKPHLNSIKALIIANVSLSGNFTKLVTSPSIRDFTILKSFNVNTHHPNAPKIIEVIWSPPILHWTKCNTDGSALGSPGQSSCAGIFRNNHGESLGCFAANLGISNSFYAELMGVILAVECAIDRNWNNLWIESDSKLANLAVKSPNIVPWQLKNRWLNCVHLMSNMNCMITHIYREGNHCADKLARLGLALDGFLWWNSPPVDIREDLIKNRLGLPFYRFV